MKHHFAKACNVSKASFLMRLLFLLALSTPLGCSGALIWVYGGNTVDELQQATGVSSGGNGASIAWKNAQLHVEQQNDVDPGWNSCGVISSRSCYSRESWSLIGLDDLFGSSSNALPTNALVKSAWLWVYVEQSVAPPRIALSGVASDQQNWKRGAVSWRYKDADNLIPWQSSTNIGPEVVKEYGRFTPAEQVGWYKIPVNVSNVLEDLRSGAIGSLALVPVSGVRSGISTWYVSSDASSVSQQRPGLFVEYTAQGSGSTNFYIAQDGQTPQAPYTNWMGAASNISSVVVFPTDDSVLHIGEGTYTDDVFCADLTYTWDVIRQVDITGAISGACGLVVNGSGTLNLQGAVNVGWLDVISGSLVVNGQIYADQGIDVALGSRLSGQGTLQPGTTTPSRVHIQYGAEFLEGEQRSALQAQRAGAMDIEGSLRVDGVWNMLLQNSLTGGTHIRDHLELGSNSLLRVRGTPDDSSTYVLATVTSCVGQFAEYDLPPYYTLSYKEGRLALKPGGGQLGATNVMRKGGLVVLDLTISDQTGWVAVSTSDWITVVSGRSGTGSGTIQLQVNANVGRERSSTVWIAGMEYTIRQQQARTCYLDFDGDDKADVGIYSPETGTWSILESSTQSERLQSWGWYDTVPVAGDYDGDGRYDVAVYNDTHGIWYILQSASGISRTQPWGFEGAIPVPADYDGDGITDVAVYDALRGAWCILQSSTGTGRIQSWGWGESLPVVGDYDGDGKADCAVYWPEVGQWYILHSSDQSVRIQSWGWYATEACQGDFDADGMTDVAVYWPPNGSWNILQSSDGRHMSTKWGWSEAWPVPADYDGDSSYDITVQWSLESYWYIWQSASSSSRILKQGLPDAEPINLQIWINAMR